MSKQINLNFGFSIFSTIILTFALTLSAISGAEGQTADKVFKVGDSVLASPSSLKDEKYWRHCKVTEVHNFVPNRAYSIVCEPQTKGGSTSSFLVNEDWVKPDNEVQTDAAAKDNVQTPDDKQDRNQAETPVPDQNEAVACPTSDAHLKGKTALENSFKGAIVKDFEKEPEPGADGRVTVTVQALNVGASHPYRVYEDPNEARGKTVYPVRAKFTTCTDYNRRIVLVKRERAFSCYKNAAGEWVCDIFAAANTNVKDETKSIDKPNK